MSTLNNTRKTVSEILEHNELARNKDDELARSVYNSMLSEKGMDLHSMSADEFFKRRSELRLPPFETIRRSRQIVQHDKPWLAGCTEVEAMRKVKEDEYKAFSLNHKY